MKKKIFKLLVVLSSAIILIALIFFTNGLKELANMFSTARLYWIGIAFGCMIMYWILDAAILHTIAGGLLERQPLKDTVRVTMIGQFFNAITPLSGAGQPVQAYVMVKDGVKPGHAASIMIIKTFLHQLIIVLYSLTAFILRGPLFADRILHFYYLYALGLLINIAFLILYALFIYKKAAGKKMLLFIFKLLKRMRLKKAEIWQVKVESELESFGEGAVMIKTNAGILVKLIAYQIVQFTFYFSIPYFIHLAVESNHVNALDMITAQSMIILISLLVPSPGATGGVEGLSYLFYGMFFRQGYIIPVILIFRLLTYYSSIFFGGLFAVFAREKPLKQRE
ncbi:MAG: flippase-like domain-containing protein [Ruminiclostridium sp.]|nr:flippase-like domain-containing protein [Ruminiclostridium sp.]